MRIEIVGKHVFNGGETCASGSLKPFEERNLIEKKTQISRKFQPADFHVASPLFAARPAT